MTKTAKIYGDSLYDLAAEEKLTEEFGMLQYAKAEGVEGEFGFLTPVMPEGEYEKKAETFRDSILGMIRVEE